jgi:hypothetical protein
LGSIAWPESGSLRESRALFGLVYGRIGDS